MVEYVLTAPRWELTTDTIGVVKNFLYSAVCNHCKEDVDFYKYLNIEEEIEILLGTPCGAEMMFHEEEE